MKVNGKEIWKGYLTADRPSGPTRKESAVNLSFSFRTPLTFYHLWAHQLNFKEGEK